ncbi:hypothetical protein FOA52_014226 [Chlamydomonas sp. UWO 241]|nr:hypothetical protein FOA52_014226 [Chlamydomonas sp. UWO 241]
MQVGTTYQLTFVVYDTEGLNATVSRAVTIVSCCPLDRPYLCSGSCEAVDCAMLSQLESAIAALGGGDIANVLLDSPVLVLLPAVSANLTAAALLGEPPSNQTVFVVYGTSAPVSLLPCTSIDAVGSCAAAAVQLSADGSLTDLSSSISVTDVTPVDDGTDDGASAATAVGRCSAPALSLGTCLPGVYVLQYSVPGASQPAHLSVVVEQLAATKFAYTFESPDGSSLSAATDFATQLSSNATLLLATAIEHMPLFGVGASSVRGVVMNSSSIVARVAGASTVYDISVVLTVTTGSSTSLPLPSGSGRRLRSASLDLGAPDATAFGTAGSKRHRASLIAVEHNIRPPTSDNADTSRGGGATARLRVASACVGGVVASLLRVRLLIDDLAVVLAGSDCNDGGEDCNNEGESSISPSPDGTHQATTSMRRRVMGMHSRRRHLLQPGCNAPNAGATAAPGGAVVSGGANGSQCTSPDPSSDDMYMSLIMGAASDVAALTTAIQESTDSMAVTIVPLVDTFDLYDTAAQAAYTQMYNDVSWTSGNVSAQLEVVDDLLSRTLVAQAAFNNELSATGALMASTLTLLQQQLARTAVNAQLVLEGLGILNDATLADFQQCVFNASVGRRFAFKVGTTTTASRRSLLPTASGTPSGDPYVFQGYDVFPDAASYQYDLYDTWNADKARFVGSGYSNRVLSGLLLHTVRRPVASVTEGVRLNASTDELEMQLRVCRSTGYPSLVTACRNEAVSTTVAYVDGGGMGNDPVFSQLSSLYNKEVSMSDFYNMSDGSPEVNSMTGIPFGFFHTPLKGFDDGYPLLFDTHMPEKRIVDLLHYIQDGGMLSAQLTRSMTLQMVTYNPEAVVFGYFSATFTWIDSGVISMTSKLMALPAVEYNHGISSWQLQTLLPDILLIILIVAYIALTSWDVVASLRSQRKMSAMSKQRSPVPAASIHHNGPTLSSRGLSVHCAGGASIADIKDRAIEAEIAEAALEAEDAVRNDRGNGGVRGGGAVAVRRAQKYTTTMSPFWIAFEAALCALTVVCGVLWFVYSAQLVSSNVFVTRFGAYDADAFAPARFLLPMRGESAAVAAHYVLYYFLQGFVLIGLILRLIMHLSFQRRLSIIGGTLAALVPELFHFLLVVTVLFCMMAVFLNTVFGYRVYAASTFGEAIFTLFKMLVFGDDTDLYYACTIPGLDAPLERSMASAFRGLASVVIVWVLRMYLATFIIMIYAGLNQYAKRMPAVSQDLRRMFKWWAQKVRRKTPSNTHIEKMLDKVLEEGGGPSGLLARARATVARTVLRSAAGPAVRANLGTLPYFRSSNRGGIKGEGAAGGGGIKLDSFSSLVGSKELGAALISISGRRTFSGSLSDSRNTPFSSGDSGWLSDRSQRAAGGEGQRGSEAGRPLSAPQRMSSHLSINQIAIAASALPLPGGHNSSLADMFIERQHAAAAATRGELEHPSQNQMLTGELEQHLQKQMLPADPLTPGDRATRRENSLGISVFLRDWSAMEGGGHILPLRPGLDTNDHQPHTPPSPRDQLPAVVGTEPTDRLPTAPRPSVTFTAAGAAAATSLARTAHHRAYPRSCGQISMSGATAFASAPASPWPATRPMSAAGASAPSSPALTQHKQRAYRASSPGVNLSYAGSPLGGGALGGGTPALRSSATLAWGEPIRESTGESHRNNTSAFDALRASRPSEPGLSDVGHDLATIRDALMARFGTGKRRPAFATHSSERWWSSSRTRRGSSQRCARLRPT